jgi:GrpB-like predicted nucleotidyltransferase (UPF0157 family)
MVRTIEVVQYDVAWTVAFNQEAAALSRVFGDSLVAIHHIGSTSIPGLLAKPIVGGGACGKVAAPLKPSTF